MESIDKKVEQFLCELVRFKSLPGHESNAMDYLERQFGRLDVGIRKVPLPGDLKSDPEYSNPIEGINYAGRHNLRIVREGAGNGRGLVLNAHVDVVPASPSMPDAFSGAVRDGMVCGRGACDTKGSIASIFALLHMLEENDITLPGDLIIHLVVEEENGGNGTLAMVRAGEDAAGCIVMEPTEFAVLTSIRGAVWFRIGFFGRAGHSGQAGRTKSALLMAHEAITALQQYHARLLENSRNIPLFSQYDNPMPITFGHLAAGDWPASAPNHAILEGVLGFLPNMDRERICTEFRQTLLEGELIAPDNLDVEFTYRHDSSVIAPEHPLPQSLLAAARRNKTSSRIDAMPASCDAWFYNNMLNIPTVVFGPGSLKYAHSNQERIGLDQVALGGKILFDFVRNFWE